MQRLRVQFTSENGVRFVVETLRFDIHESDQDVLLRIKPHIELNKREARKKAVRSEISRAFSRRSL